MRGILSYFFLFISFWGSTQTIDAELIVSEFFAEAEVDSIFDAFHSMNPDFDWHSFIESNEQLSADVRDQADFTLAITSLMVYKNPDYSEELNQIPFQIAKNIGDSVLLAKTLSASASNLSFLGRYEECFENYFKALELLDEVENREQYAKVVGNIGMVYLQIDDIENARKYLKLALEQELLMGQKKDALISMFNLGQAYILLNLYDSAIWQYEQAIDGAIEIDFAQLEAYSYSQLATIYLEINEYQKAINYQKKGLKWEVSTRDETAMVDSHGILGSAYASLEMRDSSTYHFDKAIEIGERLGVINKLMNLYQKKAESFALLKNFEAAYEATIKYIVLRDSSENIEVKRVTSDLREKYETDQKEAENLLLVSENERQQLLLIGAGFLIVLIIFILTYVYRTNKKTQKLNARISSQALELNRSNQTKDRLFSIIGHDLRSPITSFETLTSVINSYLQKGETEKVKEVVKHVDSTAKNLKFLLENLLNWSLNQQSEIQVEIRPIALKTIVEEVIDVYAETSALKKVNIVSEIKEENVLADYDTLSTILRNLISNAIKFSPENSQVIISAQPLTHFIEISIKDEGIGISEENQSKLFTIDKSKVRKGTAKEKGTGLGLVLVKEFAELNNGQVKVESTEKKGSIFYLYLPQS